jgi:ribonucleotide reductase beta subunit family protein with ferritin-like domain
MESNSFLKNTGSDRYTVFPIKYDDLWSFYKKHISTFWVVEEIGLQDDIVDWNNKLNDNERFFISNVLAFFAASDGVVNENLVLNFYSEIQIPEARQFYATQMQAEAVHCVAPETQILTNNGYFNIKKLMNQEVNIWNGTEWSSVTVKKTSDRAKLLRVILNNGMELTCTEEHKWHMRVGNQSHPERCKNKIILTKNLKKDDVIIKNWNYPLLNNNDPDEFLNPYTHGFFCGDGSYSNNYPCVYLYGDKKLLLPFLKVSSNKDGVKQGDQNRIQCYLTNKINKSKFTVPINYSLKTKLLWLEGYIDADGTSYMNPKKTCQSLQISSINKDFLKDVQLLLSTIGIDSNIKLNHKEEFRLLPTNNSNMETHKMYLCKKCYVLYISCSNTVKLYNYGLRPKRVVINTIDKNIKSNKSLIKIVDIIDEERYDETYCFNEPKNHTGIFNGILTGQSEQYALLIDTYISDPKEKLKLFNAIETIPAIKRKADWALKYIEEGTSIIENIPKECLEAIKKAQSLGVENLDFFTKQRPSFAQRLLAFVCVEGIFFSGSFCAIYWIKSKGLLPGLCTANEFIAKDESLHAEFAVNLYNTLEDKLDEESVHSIFKEAVDIEIEFITESLPVSLLGMNCNLMSQHIQSVADFWLIKLGYSKLYNVEGPFGFMEMLSLHTHTNFFEQKVDNYARAGVGNSHEDNKICFDDDDF